MAINTWTAERGGTVARVTSRVCGCRHVELQRAKTRTLPNAADPRPPIDCAMMSARVSLLQWRS